MEEVSGCSNLLLDELGPGSPCVEDVDCCKVVDIMLCEANIDCRTASMVLSLASGVVESPLGLEFILASKT